MALNGGLKLPEKRYEIYVTVAQIVSGRTIKYFAQFLRLNVFILLIIIVMFK